VPYGHGAGRNEVTAFFSQSPETSSSEVPKLLDAEMVKVFEDALD
jgi:hypothetical protein